MAINLLIGFYKIFSSELVLRIVKVMHIETWFIFSQKVKCNRRDYSIFNTLYFSLFLVENHIKQPHLIKGYMQCQTIFTTIERSNPTVHVPKISPKSAEY